MKTHMKFKSCLLVAFVLIGATECSQEAIHDKRLFDLCLDSLLKKIDQCCPEQGNALLFQYEQEKKSIQRPTSCMPLELLFPFLIRGYFSLHEHNAENIITITKRALSLPILPTQEKDVLVFLMYSVNNNKLESGLFAKALNQMNESVIQFLVDQDYLHEDKNRNGQGALQAAVMFDRVDLVARLIKRNYDPNEPDQDGMRSLHWVRSVPVLQWLIDAGADIKLLSNAGFPPHDMIKSARCTDVFDFMVDLYDLA